jgi:hypothetical protein
VFQFDWKAAEWSLLIQISGHALPDGDPYGPLSGNNISRKDIKDITLKSVYGSGVKALSDQYGHNNVNLVSQRIAVNYPMVATLLDRLKEVDAERFEGFNIHLGDVRYKRPNHYIQTALQCCKYELIHRLVQEGCHQLAVGDLHDNFIFQVGPDQTDLAARSITEIKKLSFGRYRLTPEFGDGLARHWR